MRGTLIAAVLAAATPCTPAFAADASDDAGQPAQPEAVTRYEPDFFETYNVVNAWDMVARVPGFTVDLGDNVRGFGGAAGNVLIDGERPSSKQGLQTILRRIPASQVARLEHVRGSVGGIDMRGQTEVVNVIRREGAAGSGSFEAQLKARESAVATFRGEVSYSDQLAGWSYTANLERDTNRNRWGGTEILRSVDGALIERRNEDGEDNFRNWQTGGEAERTFGAFTVRLNGQAEIWWFDYEEPSFAFDDSDALFRLDLFDIDEEGYNYEFGGDIERAFGEDWSVKLILLNSFNHFEAAQRFDRFRPTGFDQTVSQDFDRDRGESIARAFATWRPSDRHAIEFGAEGAYNFLESDVRLSVDDGSGPVEIDIPVSNTKVEEYRGEAFASWIWTMSPEWTLESGLLLEYSEIEQSGEGANTRDFFFPKPSLTATWDYAENQQVSFLLEREIAQLDFINFASSTSVNDDQTNLGNPDLEPDKTWRAQVEWERRFWDEGAVSLRARYERIEDLQDLVPITAPDGRRFDAPGNIGTGEMLRVLAETTLPLDRLGLDNAILELRGELFEHSVTDPVTGEERDFSGWWDYSWRVDFRHDFPDAQWSWGFDYAKGGVWRQFFLDEIRSFEDGHGDLDIFVETTRFFGVTLRADLENIGNVDFTRTRQFFDAPRDVGTLDRIEFRDKNVGLTGRLTVRGTF